MKKYLDCFKLNWRIFRHAAAGRWMSENDIAAGYDTLADSYDSLCLVNLSPVTDRLLAALPDEVNGAIADLGCGTGYITAALEKKYPEARIFGVDVSGGMLIEAAKVCSRARLHQSEMLRYLSRLPSGSLELIVSAWAIGHSQPAQLIAQAERVLRHGGTFAFVVSLADTLHPVFYAYRRCMSAFPDRVNKAVWPHYPQDVEELTKKLRRHGFTPAVLEENRVAVFPPGPQERQLPWLLKTGVLAGFDQVLPLAGDPEMAAYFEQELASCREIISHHYVMMKNVRN